MSDTRDTHQPQLSHGIRLETGIAFGTCGSKCDFRCLGGAAAVRVEGPQWCHPLTETSVSGGRRLSHGNDVSEKCPCFPDTGDTVEQELDSIDGLNVNQHL